MSSLQMFPVYLEAQTTVTQMVVGPMRSGVPTLFGMTGTEASGENVWSVAMEWADRYAALNDKAAKEEQHLNRFLHDFQTETRNAPYASISVGADPPDFSCVAPGGGAIGVEVTQLTLERRLETVGHFRRFQQAVISTNQDRFRDLREHIVFVSFDGPDGRVPKDLHQNTLIAALTGYHPPQFAFTEMPDPAPPNAVHKFGGGSLVAIRLEHGSSSPFYRLRGWDLEVAPHGTIRQSDAWDLFRRLIDQHDQPGVDDLIVSAEAPP